MSGSSNSSSISLSTSRGSRKSRAKIQVVDESSQKSLKTSPELSAETKTPKSLSIVPTRINANKTVTIEAKKTKERNSMSPNMKARQKTNSSGMDILSQKEMLKFEHASI